jgi:hypothetical protein
MTPTEYWIGWRWHGAIFIIAFTVIFWTVGYFVLKATR